jgi:hypothetical protein
MADIPVYKLIWIQAQTPSGHDAPPEQPLPGAPTVEW